MLKTLSKGAEACVTVTLFDGLVIARALFHHSMNYRSVCIYGIFEEITDPEEKNEGLRIVTEHIIKGRWDEARLPTPNELKGTRVMKIKLELVSAKVATGPPEDDAADYSLPIWGGLIPVITIYGPPTSDGQGTQKVEIPASVKNYKRTK